MKKKKLLIIDDEVSFSKLLKLNLERTKKYEVRVENSGPLGLSAAREFKPDLILLDIAIPGMDGYEIASAIRQDSVLSDTSIIFLTGKDFDERGMQQRVSQLGAFASLCKACSFEEILAKVKEVSNIR